MSLSKQSRAHLGAMGLIERVSQSLETVSWIWGGYTADIFLGRMLREHDDLDYLTLNLHQLQSDIAAAFSKHGWQAKHLANGDLKVEKDYVKIHLGNVEFHEFARWTHNGERGSLLFPRSWLSETVVKFYGIGVHVVAPELQYVLKEHPEFLNPNWLLREKDILEKEYVRDILVQKGTEICSLHKLVKSI